jgi:imidazolonepropionase-like amidohydrolase
MQDLRGRARLLLIAVAVAAATPARPAEPPAPSERPAALAIVDATIITASGPPLRNATLVARGGKIAAVGLNVEVPKDAEVVQGKGMYVMPGLVETHSHLGLHSLPDVEAHVDNNEWSEPVVAQMRAIDALHSGDPAVERAIAGGVTTLQVLPGSSNLVGGQSAILKLRGGSSEQMLFRGAPPGMKLAFGENPKRAHGERFDRSPLSRMGNAAVLRQALVEARDYRRRWDEHRSRAQADADPPARDLKLEALADLMEGKFRAHVHVYRSDDVLTVFRIADEFGFKIASLQHCLDGYKVAEEIARRGVGVATFADRWGFKMETQDATPENAARLNRAGVRVALMTDHPVIEQRYLIHEAARAVRYGLPEEEAYRSVTLNPAWMLGIDDRVGSLEPGKDADIVLFDGAPLSVRSHVARVWIDGTPVYERRRGKR